MVKKEVFDCGCYRVSGNFYDDNDETIATAVASAAREAEVASRNASQRPKDLDLIAGSLDVRFRIRGFRGEGSPREWRTAPLSNLSHAAGFTREKAIRDFGRANYQLLEDPLMPLQEHIYGDGMYRATLEKAQLAVKLEEMR
ncbi:MAG: hypothetical protein AABW73_00700 [Nanoarchaeota archaeon]